MQLYQGVRSFMVICIGMVAGSRAGNCMSVTYGESRWWTASSYVPATLCVQVASVCSITLRGIMVAKTCNAAKQA